jgi:hypothetical protein
MTTPPLPNDDSTLAARAGQLTESVERLTGAVAALRVAQRRMQLALAGVVAALALLLVLSVVVAWVAVTAQNASQEAADATSQAARNREAARVTCEAANQGRAAQVQLWSYVLELSTEDRTPTPAEQRRIAAFRAYVGQVFAQRDCANPTTPPTPVPLPTPTR